MSKEETMTDGGVKEKLKEKYVQFRVLQENIEKLQQQLQLIAQQQEELALSIEALQEIITIPLDNEVLAPVANGIFLKTALRDNQTLVVNLGADVAVEKTPDEVIALLAQQQNELQERNAEADAILQALSREAVKIYKELEKGQAGKS